MLIAIMSLRNDSCQTGGSTLNPFNIKKVQNVHHLFQNHSITTSLTVQQIFKIQTMNENPHAIIKIQHICTLDNNITAS